MSYITILSLFIFAFLIKNTECNTEKTTEIECNTHKIITEVAEQFKKTVTKPIISDANMYALCDRILTPQEFGGFGCTSEHDPRGHYVDLIDCFDHFTSIYTINDDMVSNGNTSTCRIFYTAVVNLVTLKLKDFSYDVLKNMSGLTIKDIDPSVYCPYIGKTGGDKCIDAKKTANVNVDVFFDKYRRKN